MNDREFASKTDREGGIFGGILGYGLKSTDIDDPDSELRAAVADFEDIVDGPEFSAALENLHKALEAIEREEY